MNTIKTFLLSLTVLTFFTAQAQLTTPQPSPAASVSQVVGLTDVEVTYSKPGMKDRVVFGELVPFGKIWRTGANKATSVSFSTDVTIGGAEVKAGTYSLFTIPNKEEWTIMLNSETELWGAGDYDAAKEVAKFMIKPSTTKDAYETFTIDFSHLKGANGHMNLRWENTLVAIPIETGAMYAVEKQIKEILVDGPGAGTYYNAARFYLENDKDIDQAIAWINTAIEKRPNAFWYMHQKAKMQAKKGDVKAAIATAEKSMKMASENEAGDYGYVASNEKLIAKLKKK
jgi:tetratricopeptide (TPR) repeat protein